MSDSLVRAFLLGVCVAATAACSSGGESKDAAPASAPVATSGPQRVTGTAPPAANGFPAFIVLEPIDGAVAIP